MTKGRRTASRILDAAEMLFTQYGYEAAALRDIAAAANIQQPGLYKHFESKEALYRQVLQRALQPLADVMEETLSRPQEEESFRTLTDRLIDVLTQHPNVSTLLIRSILSPPSGRDEIGLEWVNRLAEYGRSISSASRFDIDPDRLSLQIVGIFNLLFGYFWAAPLIGGLSGSDPLSPGLIARQKELLADFVATIEDHTSAKDEKPASR